MPDEENITTQKDSLQTTIQTTDSELKTTTESSEIDKTTTDDQKGKICNYY